MKNYIIKVVKLLFVLSVFLEIPFTGVKAAAENRTTGRRFVNVDNLKNEKEKEQYTYKITPLTDGVCSFFYVETEDPNPKNFRYVDEASVYASGASDDNPKPTNITWSAKEYPDVRYLDKKTLRVNGGYLFYSERTDGGKLRLEKKEGKTFVDTGQTVTIPQLRRVTDYLIATYTDDSMSFFEKVTAAQNGYRSLCMYAGIVVTRDGEYIRDPVAPYDLISTDAYKDKPAYSLGGMYSYTTVPHKSLLSTEIYPFYGTSKGFPSQIAAVAKKLEPSCSWEWDDYIHYEIHVTFNGETKSYGGAGFGDGRAITDDQIMHWYSFDGTDDDAYMKNSWGEIRAMHNDYAKLPTPKPEANPSKLTWEKIENTIETGINYIRLQAFTNYEPGQDSEDYRRGYACFYKDENDDLTYFSDEWFDGRYYNDYEFFEKGTTLEDENTSTADIILENVRIPVPKDGKEYLYNNSDINSLSEYDTDTGIWKGLMKYEYDKKSGTWISSIYSRFNYKDENRKIHTIEDTEFKDAMILTLDEVKDMGIDRNANINPVSYYNYDGTVPPGTKVN